MSKTKTNRSTKSQLGQFFTPLKLAQDLVSTLKLSINSIVLEPSAGDGAFLVPLIKQFMQLHTGTRAQRLEKTLGTNIFAMEIDPSTHAKLLYNLTKEFGPLPRTHNIICGDFFKSKLDQKFDFIVGNPPFGGTLDPSIQDELDTKFGERDGLKIKKETYSFFIISCVEMLNKNGKLLFICSDTFLTIPTMKGLREFLLNRGKAQVNSIEECFEETQQPMVILDFILTGKNNYVMINNKSVDRNIINLTGNKSWQINNEFIPFFMGPKLGDFMIASSGMTIGNNELFLRNIVNDKIQEPYDFEFFDDPITLSNEITKARLGRLSQKQKNKIIQSEKDKKTRKNIKISKLDQPININLPNSDYCYYNKSSSAILFAKPKSAIFWRNNGEAVLTYKKNGNWYLHGVGGAPFFKKEGLTWQLISKTLNVRYLPKGYILDSGAPCAFLRDGVDKDELWFIIGWALTNTCTRILKEVINHTRNIQSKDFEKLPYPFWVNKEKKKEAIIFTKKIVQFAMDGKNIDRSSDEIIKLSSFYDLNEALIRENLKIEYIKSSKKWSFSTGVKTTPIIFSTKLKAFNFLKLIKKQVIKQNTFILKKHMKGK